jgi:hypothetical protein
MGVLGQAAAGGGGLQPPGGFATVYMGRLGFRDMRLFNQTLLGVPSTTRIETLLGVPSTIRIAYVLAY